MKLSKKKFTKKKIFFLIHYLKITLNLTLRKKITYIFAGVNCAKIHSYLGQKNMKL